MFDYLNSRHMRGKGYKAPIRKWNLHIYKSFFKKTIGMLESLTLKDGTPVFHSRRKTCVVGLCLAMKTVLALSEELLTGDTPKMT